MVQHAWISTSFRYTKYTKQHRSDMKVVKKGKEEIKSNNIKPVYHFVKPTSRKNLDKTDFFRRSPIVALILTFSFRTSWRLSWVFKIRPTPEIWRKMLRSDTTLIILLLVTSKVNFERKKFWTFPWLLIGGIGFAFNLQGHLKIGPIFWLLFFKLK